MDSLPRQCLQTHVPIITESHMSNPSPDELLLFATGRLEDPSALQRIREDLKDPNGEAWSFLEGLEVLSETALDIDWGRLTAERLRESGGSDDESATEPSESQHKLDSVGDTSREVTLSPTSQGTLLIPSIWRRYPLSTLGLAAAVMAAIGIVFWRGNGRGPQLVARLNDAGGVVTLDKNGHLSGLESAPKD